MSHQGTAVLIDGNSLLYRAFYAMPNFATLENQPTNAVYGLTTMLLRLIQDEKPDLIVVAFDPPVKTFRHEEYEGYKAHRKPVPDDLISQSPIAREMVEAFSIPVVEVEGYEADDVVGTLARKAESEGFDVTIVTGDLDALQLVDDKVRVMTTIKGVTETVIYDEEAVRKRYGLSPKQIPDFKALKGDPSDNIPGVSGVGDKTAARLIQDFGSLENLLANQDAVAPPRLRATLSESSDVARLSKRLATIVTEVPIDISLSKCKFLGPDYDRLRAILKRLEFRSLLARLPEPSAQRQLFAEESRGDGASIAFTLVQDAKALGEMISKSRESDAVAFCVHGDDARGLVANAMGVAFALPKNSPYYVGLGSETGIGLEDLREVFEADDIAKQGYNLKYSCEMMRRAGIALGGPAFDVMLAAYLLNPARGSHDLREIASVHAGIELPAMPADTNRSGSLDGGTPAAQNLAAEADVVAKLVPILQAKLEEDGLSRLMSEVEMPLVPILAFMELAGMAVDTEWLAQLSETLASRICAVEREIYDIAGTEFNIGSPKQLQTILFDKLGLPTSKKTKTGFSTDADTLAALAPAHEIVAKILQYRELTKLKSTYVDTLPGLVNPETGRVHTSLNQAVTATGRLSSSEPNLQNIPIKTEVGRRIRKAFVASPGNVLVSADYSQIELRILAHVSGDPELVRAFRDEVDVHRRTATKIFGVPPEQVDDDMRRQAKTVNFAVIYGMSEYGLSRELSIPAEVARHYIESYFQQYPGVKEYAARTLARARLSGYVESLLGRRRYISELNSPNRSYRELAERAAVNMPIQGTAADIVKIAMIRVQDALTAGDFGARLIMQVHDELLFDTPAVEVERLIPMVRESMEGAFALDPPLKVDVKMGRDWCMTESSPTDESEDASASSAELDNGSA